MAEDFEPCPDCGGEIKQYGAKWKGEDWGYSCEDPHCGWIDVKASDPADKKASFDRAFQAGWALLKMPPYDPENTRFPREPSNIMMRRIDPVKLQEMAQRFHDNVLDQINAGTYETPTMQHPLFPYGFDENRYKEFIEGGGKTGSGYIRGEYFDDGIPLVDMATPSRNYEGRYSVPKVSWGDQWVVQTPNGEWHVVNSEGVGGSLNAESPQNLDVRLDWEWLDDADRPEGETGRFGMLPMGGFQLGVDDIAGLLGTEEMPLENVIDDRGKDRLYSNYMGHLRALRNAGLGGGSGAFTRDELEGME